jgi:hypothetical protein
MNILLHITLAGPSSIGCNCSLNITRKGGGWMHQVTRLLAGPNGGLVEALDDDARRPWHVTSWSRVFFASLLRSCFCFRLRNSCTLEFFIAAVVFWNLGQLKPHSNLPVAYHISRLSLFTLVFVLHDHHPTSLIPLHSHGGLLLFRLLRRTEESTCRIN